MRTADRNDGRERARIIGDPNNNWVELPARRGRKGILVAKTCIKCGELRLAEQYGLTGHSRSPDPQCNPCRNEAQRGKGAWRGQVENTKRRDAIRQARTLPTAKNYGNQWTAPDLEVALSPKYTSLEAAKILGRTKYAVETMRRRHKREPKLDLLTGLGRSGGL